MSAFPAARDLQLVADDQDDQLTAMAQARRPGVKHWWGRRQEPGWNGAVCYLCDGRIASWPSRWPMTEDAITAVHHHRRHHIHVDLGVSAPEHEGTS